MELYQYGFGVCLVGSGIAINNSRPCLTGRSSFPQILAVSPLRFTLNPCQSMRNEALRYSSVCLHKKYLSILANAYSPEEDAGREVESPVESQMSSVEERENGVSMRKEKVGNGFWKGVLEETGQIEWPPFQRVVATTVLVLAVIVGSSTVLFTVNAVLAELSDKIFDGIGVQDIFWGNK